VKHFRFLEESSMRRKALIVLGIVVAATAMAVAAAQPKVTICHIPPGNPANAHTITVGAPAVPAHLAHGDTLGPCSTVFSGSQ